MAAPVRIGLESTVVGIEGGEIVIYRPGGTTKEALSAIAPTTVDNALAKDGAHPKAPGMKYRHHAPSAPLTVYTGEAGKVAEGISLLCGKDG